MQKPIAEKGEICPFHQKGVEKVCHKCPLYVQLRGTDPNTGKEIDHWGCSFMFMPTLLIENSQQSRQTGAAVESFRNEMVKANERQTETMVNTALYLGNKGPKLIEN